MILVECPLNSLSFGNVSLNILRELFKAKKEIILFPIGDRHDLSAYNLEPEFQVWIQSAIENKWKHWHQEVPALRLWHLMGSESRKTKNQTLYTFYECSNPTQVERAIASNQDTLFFSSSYAKKAFESFGIDCGFIPLGFDPDFKKTNIPRPNNVVQFGLMGKFEYRKHTAKIIRAWLKRYGNNPAFNLNLCVTNPFFKTEEMNGVLATCFDGKHYNNVNVLPYLKTNEDVNAFMNFIDIDLGGLSGAEGWNLPSFNATCLGKWSIVLNATSHKDWADKENSILVEPTSTIEAHDGVFFKKGSLFNQGVFYDWDEKGFNDALDIAETKVGQINTAGVELSQLLTYKNMVSQLLSAVEPD